MINCTYNRQEHIIRISGHANYAVSGADIVCAGVTALEIALEDYLRKQEMLGDNVKISIKAGEAEFYAEKSEDVFDCIWCGLTQIAVNYPQYVSAWG